MVEFNKFNSLLDLDSLRSACEQSGRVVKFKKGECFAYAGDVLGRWGFLKGHPTFGVTFVVMA